MKFSVLIAHFNNSKYFKDCYDSLLLQTSQNWEAIILDDFSNPEELENVENLIKNDNRFQLYKNKKNQSPIQNNPTINLKHTNPPNKNTPLTITSNTPPNPNKTPTTSYNT